MWGCVAPGTGKDQGVCATGSRRELHPWLLSPRSSLSKPGPRVSPGVPGAPGHGAVVSVLGCFLGAESRRRAQHCGPGTTSGRGCLWPVLQDYGYLIGKAGEDYGYLPKYSQPPSKGSLSSPLPRLSMITSLWKFVLMMEFLMWPGALSGGLGAGVASQCPEGVPLLCCTGILYPLGPSLSPTLWRGSP